MRERSRASALLFLLLLAAGGVVAWTMATSDDDRAPRVAPVRAGTDGTRTMSGRVADRRGSPVAGAEVALRVGAEEVVGRSGPEGRFSLRTTVPPAGVRYGALRAVRGAEAGVRSLRVDMGGWPTDVGTLVVGPAALLAVRVLRGGAPVEGARVFASVVLEEVPQLFHDPFDGPGAGWSHAATTGGDGVARFEAVPLGDARLLALSDGPRRAEGRVRVAAPSAAIDLDLSDARDVVVTVVDEGGAGVPGVAIAIDRSEQRRGRDHGDALDDPTTPLPTDAAGTTVLRGLPRDETLFLHALGAGWAWPSNGGSDGARLEPGAGAARLDVPDARRWVWQVEAGDGDPPGEGTSVGFRPVSGDRLGWAGDVGFPAVTGAIEGTTLVVKARLSPRQVATAVLPDGRIAFVSVHGSTKTIPAPVRFVRPRTLEVLVRDEDGRPAPGVGVRLKPGSRWLGYTALTDATGRASYDALPFHGVDVHLEPNAALVEEDRWGVFAPAVTHVDLGGSARVEATVPSMRDAVISITLDGRPALPDRFRLNVRDHPDGLDGGEPPGAVFDAATGEIRFRAYPSRPVAGPKKASSALVVRFYAPGWTEGYGTLWEETPGGRFVLRLALDRSAVVDVEGDPLAQRPGVELERLWKGEWARWGGRVDGADEHLPVRRFRRVPPGTYRATARAGEVTGPVFVVTPGDSPVRTRLGP